MGKMVLGLQNLTTSMSIRNSASNYSKRGREEEAEELKLQALETRKRVVGFKHTDSINSMSRIICISSDQRHQKHTKEFMCTLRK